MITKDIKISKLLKDYPGSLEILLRTSPHFSKLQNRLLRKALAGRVTVEQAAAIAGVDLDNLLSELNHSRINDVSNLIRSKGYENMKNDLMMERTIKPEYLKAVTSDKMFFLDVRPIIDSGEDPLKGILNKTKELTTGEVLVIINSFEPIPLYSVLGKKGFLHWTEKKDDDFMVYFYKEKEADTEISLLYDSSRKITENDFENVIEIDVHELQPPEPMMKILENLYRIDDKSVMLIFHHREPVLLYPKLEERGYLAFCEKINDEKYKILIARKKVD